MASVFGLHTCTFENPTQTLTQSLTYKLNKLCVAILNISFSFFLSVGWRQDWNIEKK